MEYIKNFHYFHYLNIYYPTLDTVLRHLLNYHKHFAQFKKIL